MLRARLKSSARVCAKLNRRAETCGKVHTSFQAYRPPGVYSKQNKTNDWGLDWECLHVLFASSLRTALLPLYFSGKCQHGLVILLRQFLFACFVRFLDSRFFVLVRDRQHGLYAPSAVSVSSQYQTIANRLTSYTTSAVPVSS